MAENKPLTFVLSDESLNCYGFRVLTAGIDISLFKKNPIMLWNHSRTYRGTKDEVLPIGRWENIRKQEGQILADAVFDEKDPFAQSIKSKVEQGILSMASIGFNVVVTSEDPAVLLHGQTRPTVIKCLLKEASICDIGGNRNALKLYDAFDGEINLSDEKSNDLLPLLSQSTNNQNPNKMQLNAQLGITLGMKETPTDTQLLEKATALVQENSLLKEENATYKTEAATRRQAEIVALVDGAIAGRKITAEAKGTYIKLAEADFESTKAALDKLPAAIDLSASAQPSGETPEYKSGSAWEARLRETGQNE